MLIKHLSDGENTKMLGFMIMMKEGMVIYFLVKHLRTHGVRRV